MEYISQRDALRCPLKYNNRRLNKDISNLDGGCDTWQRYQENRSSSLLRRPFYEIAKKQFQFTLDKEAMARSIWQKRLNGTTECERWWLETRNIRSRSTGDDSDDNDTEFDREWNDWKDKQWPTEVSGPDDAGRADALVWSGGEGTDNHFVSSDYENEDDDDDNGTLYSQALPNNPFIAQAFSYQVHTSNPLSAPTISMNPQVSRPDTVSIERHDSASINYVDEITNSEKQRTSKRTEPTAETPKRSFDEHQVAFRNFLGQHVHKAGPEYENERRLEAVEKNRTLSVPRIHGEKLPTCEWKRLRCWLSYEFYQEFAMSLPNTARCASECTPMIILTNEDGELYEFQEVKKILSEEEIAKIRTERDSLQAQAKQHSDLYDAIHMAQLEGQTPIERQTTDAAKAWWAAEQAKRDAAYISWEHAEAQELALAKQQVEREVEQHMNEQDVSVARKGMHSNSATAKQSQPKHLKSLKRKLEREELDHVASGCYVGRTYDVTFDSRMLAAFLQYEEEEEEEEKEVVNAKAVEAEMDAGAVEVKKRKWVDSVEKGIRLRSRSC